MFNGYNETPSISYNEFNQERLEKKQENVAKWSYGHEAGVQQAQTHPGNRHSEFWPAKPNFMGVANVVKCNCTGCYPPTENQSYQGDTTRHRPWLPRTFPVPLNGSNESCKLPTYQWDNGLSSQGSCYAENNLAYVQENGGKYPYYRAYQNSRLPEPNQPGVITSVKEAEFGKKGKNEMCPSRGQESPVQNGTRQPAFCNPGYNLTKRPDGRNYCDPNDKHSNVASYSVDQHLVRLPVVEPFIKAVPSNLSQNRVPSTGYRSVKENVPQSYVDSGYGDPRKIPTESTMNGEKRPESFSTGQIQTGVHIDYSHLNRDFQEMEPQKLFFDNTRHPDYYSRNSIQDVLKRNNQTFDNRKDCAMSQMSVAEQHYNLPRTKYQDGSGNPKPAYEAFYPKEFEKRPENPVCFQRNEDGKNENANVHARLPRSALLFNDPRFADRTTQNSFPYQSNPVPYRNYLRPEYGYQGYNAQERYEYPGGFQRNESNEFRVPPQQMQSCEQFPPQQNAGFMYEPHCQPTPDKMQQFYLGKNPSPAQTDSLSLENRKPNYLEAIRSEEISKNGANKISPLRLLRKKKFINVPQEPAPVSTVDAPPGLDVRKFWSTWADEEEENVALTQMVVLDCQNIDPEQAKLLHLYETDPVRAVHLETGNIVIKGAKEPTNQTAPFEEAKPCEQPAANEPKIDEQTNDKEICFMQEEETEKPDERNSTSVPEPEIKSAIAEPVRQIPSPPKVFKKGKTGQENRGRKKAEVMDKWTEKKFDFLKRAEESKAAEILRHEEEKKKIIETRLSLQQSLKKAEKPLEKNVPERLSPFDENSQTDSVEDGNENTSNLPTSEYRRNKFLDYSDRKVIVNGSGQAQTEGGIEDESAHSTTEPIQADEPIKEEDVKFECEEKKLDMHPTEKLFPALNVKLKEQPGFEMDDILQKMSEINFDGSEIKFENGTEHPKKSKPTSKKPKKKKSEHQTESDERTDKLTVETVTKPTIKFSIQKSHDLKISFKVLNSSKEYFDENVGSEDAEDKGSALEDSKNSTECFTLKYKSFQRDSDRRPASGLKKNRRGFRKKKRAHEMKTPVLKIKKSRYLPQEEKDPLADDEDDAVETNAPRKTFADDYSTSDGFQVQETVDSAKIKLTFKRHKGNFETEYKINSNSAEKSGEVDRVPDEDDEHLEAPKNRCGKKSKEGKQAGAECFQNYPKRISDVESDLFFPRIPDSQLEEDSRNSSESRNSAIENYDFESESSIFAGFPSEVPAFEVATLENESVLKDDGKRDGVDESKSSEETDQPGQEQNESDVNHVIKCDEANGSAEDKRDEFSLFDRPDAVRGKEEIQQISPEFIKSTKSEEIEINHKSRDSPEVGNPNGENARDINSDLENPIGIKHSIDEESSCESKFEMGNEREKSEIIDDPDVGGAFEETPDLLGFDDETYAKIPEVGVEVDDCLNDSVGDREGKNSPRLGIPEDLENSFEDLIRDDFSPPAKNQRHSSTPEMSPNEIRPRELETGTPEELRLSSEDNLLMALDLGKVVGSSPKATPEPALESVLSTEEIGVDAMVEEAGEPTEITKFSPSISGETASENHPLHEEELDGVDSPKLEFEPESDLNSQIQDFESVKCLPDGGDEVLPVDVELDCKSRTISPSPSDGELEDGEIIDSSDESENQSSGTVSKCQRKIDFTVRKIERRHSTATETSAEKRESSDQETWPRKRFSKAKSCPPNSTFPDGLTPEAEAETETVLDIPVEDIPLPMGPSPYESCLNLEKYKRLNETQTGSEAKEKPKESIFPERVQLTKEPDSPFGLTDLENCRNPSPPAPDGGPSLQLGIFQRNSKIKFSFSRRSKFSKLSLNDSKIATPPPAVSVESETEKKEVENGDFDKNVQTLDCEPSDQPAAPTECQIEEVPNANVANEAKVSEEIGKLQNELETVELLCEDLEESVEVIDAMTDLIKDEFYEYEDIPTSEDLTNGDELEMEKVNDDKFRNIMQNCLDNAKKFLNVGNLKLFSCSVDDLFEFDCQASESTLGENEPEKPANHISRDVLLTSFGDTHEDLGLSEDIQPGDISVDFVPSFCSDVCPEILPVDNWPYLEEEVTSSPTKSKGDETDLIPSLESAIPDDPTEGPAFCLKNGIERVGRKRVISETGFHRSLASDVENFKICSKIGSHRRKTIDSFTAVSYGEDIRDIKNELLRLKNGGEEAEEKSLKCRLSLEKLTNKQDINFEIKKEKIKSFSENSAKHWNGVSRKSSKSLDYKSPSWQPKVMLFRISKNELKKMLSSKSQGRLDSKIPGESPKREVSSEFETGAAPALKKQKSEVDSESLQLKPDEGVEKVDGKVDEKKTSEEKPSLPESVKPAPGAIEPSNVEGKKRKKSRFRNLHSKRKTEAGVSTARPDSPFVDPELVLTEIFNSCDRDTKEEKKTRDFGEKVKKKRSESSERLGKETAQSRGRSKEDSKQKRREKGERKHDNRDRRREKSEEGEGERHKNKGESRKHGRHGSNHDRSKHESERRKSASGGEDKRGRSQKREAPNTPSRWVCEVCGFDEAGERVVHIKSHPFHCQSCHLAFKTESHFIGHLTKKHKDIRNQHHCLLCELSFDTEEQYQSHLETREHRHLESVEKNTINTLFTLLTGAPCPVLGLVEMKPEWLPNQAGTVHFYHQATPLSLALQYLKMHRDLSSFSTTSSTHPT